MQGETYVGANFGGRVPHSDNFHITRNQRFALTLLPIKNKPSIPITRNEFWQSSEGSYNFGLFGRLIIPEKLENSIRRTCHQERLVIFVDISNLVDFRSHWIPVRKTIETLMTLPVPNAKLLVSSKST